MKMTQSKYQKFEIATVSREKIHEAAYNPRTISEDARKRLRKMLAKHGLVQPLVWNRRTGNLVAGHQRLKQIDSLERRTDYSLQVAVVDVDESEEKALNVQMNNPSMQGDWDVDKLRSLVIDDNVNPFDMGFSDFDIEALMGGEVAEYFSDTEDIVEAKETLREIKETRKQQQDKLQKENSQDYYVTAVFASVEQKREFLKKLGVPQYEDFIPGKKLAGALGF